MNKAQIRNWLTPCLTLAEMVEHGEDTTTLKELAKRVKINVAKIADSSTTELNIQQELKLLESDLNCDMLNCHDIQLIEAKISVLRKVLHG